jgi:hypothetical protein
MTQQENPDQGEGQASIEPLSPLVKAYIDKQVGNAIKQYDATQTKGKKWRNSWRSESPVTKGSFIMTAAIAVATIAYALIAWGQYCAMQKIATDNSKQAQELINAATQIKNAGWTFSGAAIGINNVGWNGVGKLQDQVNQLRVSMQQSQAFFNLQNRPWLFFIPGAVQPDLASKEVLLTSRVQNFGMTPVPSAWTRVHYEIGESIPKQFRFTDSDKITPSSYASQGSVKYTESISTSSLPIFGPSASIYGWIVYRDALKGTEYHLTEFGAVVMSGIIELSEPPPIGPIDHPLHSTFSWVQIPELSCFDEGCKDYNERVAEVKSLEKLTITPNR